MRVVAVVRGTGLLQLHQPVAGVDHAPSLALNRPSRCRRVAPAPGAPSSWPPRSRARRPLRRADLPRPRRSAHARASAPSALRRRPLRARPRRHARCPVPRPCPRRTPTRSRRGGTPYATCRMPPTSTRKRPLPSDVTAGCSDIEGRDPVPTGRSRRTPAPRLPRDRGRRGVRPPSPLPEWSRRRAEGQRVRHARVPGNACRASPATKRGCSRSRRSSGTLVRMPRIGNCASACQARRRAASRVSPQTIELGEQRVVVHGDLAALGRRQSRRARPASTARDRGQRVRPAAESRAPDPRRRPATSMAWPRCASAACVQGSGPPAATTICARTRSTPVTASVTGCSTCRRAFISRK